MRGGVVVVLWWCFGGALVPQDNKLSLAANKVLTELDAMIVNFEAVG